MSYTLSIDDPDGMHVVMVVPGKYNPDILDDAKARLGAMYKQALSDRFEVIVALPDGLEESSEASEVSPE